MYTTNSKNKSSEPQDDCIFNVTAQKPLDRGDIDLEKLTEKHPCLYVTSEGELRLEGDDTDTKPTYQNLKKPCYRSVYSYELPVSPTMKAYRTGSMMTMTGYVKPTEVVREELAVELGRAPSVDELAEKLSEVRSFTNRFKQSYKLEMLVGQLLYNVGFTPFLDSAVDVSQHPQRRTMLKDDQVDISVAGKLLEVKSFNKLYDNNIIYVDDEPYVFMCSAYSQKNQKLERDYYVLVYKDDESNRKFNQWKGGGWFAPTSPVVVPCARAKTVVRKWEDTSRGSERGVFVRVADLLCWKDFVKELKQHSYQMKRNGKKLSDVEMLQCYYPEVVTGEGLSERVREEVEKPLNMRLQGLKAERNAEWF